MKIAHRGSETKVGGTHSAPQNFQIAASKAAFNILSSGLYNDKIRAIVRELACNAYDAHVAAGNLETPFEIHLPTEFEPHFSIRDFGIGLSHEDITTLYCTYFATNKNDSNLFVGALGLGSKSPFSYTEGFTVVSRFNGMKRTYGAFISEEGTPNIMLQVEEPTTEHNGLEVTFPANQGDVWEFQNKAGLALEFFNPLPKLNVEEFTIPQQEYVLRCEKWAVRPSTSDIHGVRAIQGMVQYQVGNIDRSRMNSEQIAVTELPLDIFFPIGTLSVTPSRESLSLDETTIQNILAAYTDVYNSIIEEAKKKIDECSEAYQARLVIMNLLASPIRSIIGKANNAGALHGKYANFTLAKNDPTLYEFDYTCLQVSEYKRSTRKYANKKNFFSKRTPGDRLQLEIDINGDPKKGAIYHKAVEVDKKVTFVLNDIGVAGGKYVQAYVQGLNPVNRESYCSTAYVFSCLNNKREMKQMKKEFKKAMAIIGNPPHMLMSELKKNFGHPVANITREKRDVVHGVLEVTGDGRSRRGGNGWLRKVWTRRPFADITDSTRFFVFIDKGKEVRNSKFNFYRAAEFCTFLENLQTSKLFPGITTDTSFYGVKPDAKFINDTDPATGAPIWVNLFDYIEAQIPTVLTAQLELELSLSIKPFKLGTAISGALAMIAKRKSMKTSPMREFAEVYTRCSDEKSRNSYQKSAIAAVINYLKGKNLYTPNAVMDFKNAWRSIVIDKYPMLGVSFNDYGYGENSPVVNITDAIFEYIKYMDHTASAGVKVLVEALPEDENEETEDEE